MTTVRPLSALHPVITEMATAAQKAQTAVVRHATVELGREVSRLGRRYTLRGRGGKQVPLDAATDVKIFGQEPVGRVRGIPEGFWHIVHYGSGKHLITTNRGRNGQGRVTRSGRTVSRIFTLGQIRRRFGEAESLGALAPIRTPYGPRQFAVHLGHGTIGRPWDAAMMVAPRIVGDALQEEQTRQLTAAFLGRL